MRQKKLFVQISVILAALSGPQLHAQDNVEAIEEVVIWGKQAQREGSIAHPGSLLTQQDLVSINAVTTEDLVKFEPSLVIRRRFIGDSNGTMGMRGSNMFQTSRSMVFADGVPLHYLLQSRWNGAPRWTMVSASEIAQVEVLYGPYSAEFSGNSMGGVVLIESAIPQEREFHFDSSYFSQSFDAYGFDDTVNGYKSYFSYGDKIGDTSLFFSYNRLDNEAQPQTFYDAASSSFTTSTAVTGGLIDEDERSNTQLFFGDTGIVDTMTENYKIKIGQDFGQWQALLNVAYEDRYSGSDKPNTYLRDVNGTPIWSGVVSQDGRTVNIPSSRLNVSELERDSLSLGLRVAGPITESINFEANINQFEVLRDESRSSLVNPQDPAYTLNGQVSDYGDTGWDSIEAKLEFAELPVQGLSLLVGLRRDSYELNLNVYNSDNYIAGSFHGYRSRSGGETSIDAIFAQFNWQLNEKWDLGLGLRHESFESDNGYFSDDDNTTPEFDLINVPKVSESNTSPKFSVAYQANSDWSFAYAVGKAYRFPIVEELFSQYSAYNSVSVANPDLKPENGLHHNFMIERAIDNGVVRVNVFQESVKDVIESQSESLPGGLSVRTFVPVDEIETSGIEFIANVDDALLADLDIRFNVAFTDSEIVKNQPDPSIEGNVYPRMPKWRGNLLATYHISQEWDAGINLQYASDSYGRLQNDDKEDGVYGAQDAYTRIGIKSTYNFNNGVALGLGIDNLTNELAYVAHPWPGRTFYANMSYDF
ncbi:MAG: TonB-dependent receptor [Pseudohongiellaceae bacterium]|nr:TonB-dependent receptor [Pseudohongiellaceae bacterium]